VIIGAIAIDAHTGSPSRMLSSADE